MLVVLTHSEFLAPSKVNMALWGKKKKKVAHSRSHSSESACSKTSESAPDNLHVHIGVPHSGNGTDRLDHMADHIDNGQVDYGPVESKV